MSIMVAIWLALAVLLFIFTFVLLFGAPYVPTLPAQRQAALDLLNLKKGQTLYELGSGDGSMLNDAAKRGLNVVGYELNPVLVIISWVRTRRYGRAVKVRWGNFWNADLSEADGIFVFLIDHFMLKLDRKIQKESKGKLKLVSHAFKIPGRNIKIKKNAMFLYDYDVVAPKR
jgi:Mycolic acid cyclopropane synthetase